MRGRAAVAVALLAAACHRGPRPAVEPSALRDATLRCRSTYAWNLATGTFVPATPADPEIALRGGRAAPRDDSEYLLLDGLGGLLGPDASGAMLTVAVVEWSPAGRGTGSAAHVLVVAPADADDAPPVCLLDVALGDREKLLRVVPGTTTIALDGFTHGAGEPLAVATQRVLGEIALPQPPEDEDAPVPPLQVRRRLVAPRLAVPLATVVAALQPAVELPPTPAEGMTTVQAFGDASGLSAQAYVAADGLGGVQIMTRLPPSADATAARDRLLSALDPACATPLATCLDAEAAAPLAGEVRFAWCACGTLGVSRWGRREMAVTTVVPAPPAMGDVPWTTASGS